MGILHQTMTILNQIKTKQKNLLTYYSTKKDESLELCLAHYKESYDAFH